MDNSKILKLVKVTLRHMEAIHAGEQAGSLLLTGDPGIGKAQPLTAKVLTTSGWKLMGDLTTDDFVITPTGEPAGVIQLFPQGEKDIYTITFHDGSQTECCLDHLWKCYFAEPSVRKTTEHVVSTAELLKLMEKNKHNDCDISIPLINPIDTPADVVLPIDSYVLGTLLGDGGLINSSIGITSTDTDLIDNIRARLSNDLEVNQIKNTTMGYHIVQKKADGKFVTGSSTNSLKENLTELGLVGCRSFDKFIPKIYKTGSFNQRLNLLRGLLDTDGTCSKNGRISFCSTSYQLARDVQELVWSIGGCAKISTRHPKYTYRDLKLSGRIAFEVQISVSNPKDLFLLERKQQRCQEIHGKGRVVLRRRIKSIVYKGKEEAQCIVVDHPDHLYITDDYIVTHNSTFVGLLGRLLGMQTIIIEVPHITEEHLINIPFVLFNPETNATQHAVEKTAPVGADGIAVKKNPKYKLVLAQSKLYSQLVSAHAISDDQYLKYMATAPAHIQQLFTALGGTVDTIPPVIASVRAQHKVILFLDEFYRQTSLRIRNILRGILNRKIGMHRIPASAYLIYASNMADQGGLDEITTNQHFAPVPYDTPTKEEWFEWLISSYESDAHVKMKPEVVDEFRRVLIDSEISYKDFASGVRTSPRRWEQILLYINTSLPVSNEREAMTLLHNVRNNFLHYKHLTYSKELMEKVLKSTQKLIEKTSNIKVAHDAGLEDHDWREALDHMIDQYMKSGGRRKHIPIISGPPGIGKAQPLHSLIKVPGGWKQMGEMTIGDEIIVPDGTTALVDGVYPQGERLVYAIKLSDGRIVEACGEHLWKVKKDRESDTTIIDTHEIKRLIDNTSRWVYLPLVNPVDVDDTLLPVDPYLLGCLLGDGGLTNRPLRFTTSDAQMVSLLESPLADLGCKLNHMSKFDYTIVQINRSIYPNKKGTFVNNVSQQISELGLVGKKSNDKFIPLDYFNGSIRQREDLLAGLIDTDGYVSKTGAISIATVSNQLALDIQRLVWSIGGIANITQRYPTYTYNGIKKQGQILYNVSVRYHAPRNLTKLDRKLERLSIDYQYSNLMVRVVSVDAIGVQPVQCIHIDHPDHLYITDNYVITHNTTHLGKVAADHDLLLIDVTVSELNSDDVTGMPIPGDRTGEKIKVNFSMPKMYQQVMLQIEEAEQNLKDSFKREDPTTADQRMKEFQQQRWKYLIFLDEINTVDEKTFNALRRVILEKSFGPSDEDDDNENEEKTTNDTPELKLPNEAIVVAAINPVGTHVTDLTDHFRDVVDIIPAHGSWSSTKQYLSKQKFARFPAAVKTVAMNIIDQFVNKFKSRDDTEHKKEQQSFYLTIPGVGELYLAPREYSDMYATLIREGHAAIEEALSNPNLKKDSDIRDKVDSTVTDALMMGVGMAFHREHAGESLEDFKSILHSWVSSLPDSVYAGLTSKKVELIDKLGTVLTKYLDGTTPLTSMIQDNKIATTNNSLSNAEFMDEVIDVLSNAAVDDETITKYCIDASQPEIQFENDRLVEGSNKVSRFTNFIRALLYTLHARGYSNDRLQALAMSLNQGLSKIRTQASQSGKISPEVSTKLLRAMAPIRPTIHSIIKGLGS